MEIVMKKTVSAVVVCAGSSTRMGTDKIFMEIAGKPVVAHTLLGFEKSDTITNIVVVTKPQNFSVIEDIARKYNISKLTAVREGGKTRADSVYSGLMAAGDEYVAITDGARPCVTPTLINEVCEAAFMYGAAAPGIKMADTVKKVNADGFINTTVDRSDLVRIQTPQVFVTDEYKQLLKQAMDVDAEFTDDCSVCEYFGKKVFVTNGSAFNLKLTTPEDITVCERYLNGMNVRIGHGYDVHRFKEGRELWLCGEKIDYEFGLDGHSDADVALHALTDAILGAAALGDIGTHFPDTDAQYKGISSIILLKRAYEAVRENATFGQCDVTIIAQKPKLLPYIEKMRQNIALALETDVSNVNVKATTEEKLGFTGRLEGISAHAVCTLYKK